ncbi:histidine kinase [Oxalobacteraceae bacterium]|nr:histidine kinase [Oxalobacteraceae bacterium]
MEAEVPCPSSHPLDLIPFFRRWSPSPLRDVLYTALWNCAIGLFLAAAGQAFTNGKAPFSDYLWHSLVVSNICGYLIHLALVTSDFILKDRLKRAARPLRLVYWVVVIGGCVVLGISLGTALLHGDNPLRYLGSGSAWQVMLPFALFFSVFMFLVQASGERRIQAETLAARQNEQLAATARLLAEARLRALQAQIEPHFLYNTLANVVSLIEVQPTQARHMLERFIDYLRASLNASRADHSTLGAEADLIAAYLDVLAVRMGARLRYTIDIDPALRGSALAPMLLQPVVENAIGHGLEPKVEGGTVRLSARMDGARLCVEVSDTGVGLGNAPARVGGGVGLSNLKARLASLYGSAAQVQLLENQPCGVTVRLLLPLSTEP